MPLETFLENLDIESLKQKLLGNELQDEDAIDELLLTDPAKAVEQGTAFHVKKKKKGNIMSMALPLSNPENSHDASFDTDPQSKQHPGRRTECFEESRAQYIGKKRSVQDSTLPPNQFHP